jgi:hypothetical protein
MPEGPVLAGSATRQRCWGANAGSKPLERTLVRALVMRRALDGAEHSGSIEPVMAGRHAAGQHGRGFEIDVCLGDERPGVNVERFSKCDLPD